MSLEEIKKINRNSAQITKDFFNNRELTSEEVLGIAEGVAIDGSVVLRGLEDTENNYYSLTDKGKDDIRKYYLECIGEDNIRNAPDYDPNIIDIGLNGQIKDANFHDSFIKIFLITLVIDLIAYFLFGFLSLSGGLIGLISVALSWIAPIICTLIYYFDAKNVDKLAKTSDVISSQKIKSISRVKFAPILSFLVLVLMNVFSLVYMVSL